MTIDATHDVPGVRPTTELIQLLTPEGERVEPGRPLGLELVQPGQLDHGVGNGDLDAIARGLLPRGSWTSGGVSFDPPHLAGAGKPAALATVPLAGRPGIVPGRSCYAAQHTSGSQGDRRLLAPPRERGTMRLRASGHRG